MIIDILPNQYEVVAQQNDFRPWQTGLLGNLLSHRSPEQFLTVNMGRAAGHTYFTRVLASSSFPAPTKVYVTRQENLPEFSALLFDEGRVHEPVGILSLAIENSDVPRRAEFIVVDMSGEHPARFKESLSFISKSAPKAKIAVLQPIFFKI